MSQVPRSSARLVNGISSSGSFRAPGTVNAGGRFWGQAVGFAAVVRFTGVATFGVVAAGVVTGEAVVVTMSKMPGKILDPTKLFASTRDALLKSVKGTLDNEQKLGPASEVLSFHSSSGAFLRSRLIASGDRLYQVLYVGHSAEQRENPAIAAMFDSFSIGAQ